MDKPFRQAVMAVILKDDGTFLIGSSPRDGGYKFPQGGLEDDETKLEGLFRELYEELGTVLIESDFITTLYDSYKYPYPSDKTYSKKYSGQELHVFVIKHRESMTFIPQDDEFDKLIWIKKEQMNNYDFKHREPAYRNAINTVCDL